MKQADVNQVMVSGKITKVFKGENKNGEWVACSLESVNTYKKRDGTQGDFTTKGIFITTWGASVQMLGACSEGEKVLVMGVLNKIKNKKDGFDLVVKANTIHLVDNPAVQQDAFPEKQDDDDDLPF